MLQLMACTIVYLNAHIGHRKVMEVLSPLMSRYDEREKDEILGGMIN